jgi:ABC-2 type transport system ATP-binding protein
LIFDEPFSGFDPVNANLLRDEILELRDRGATIILSTHNMASVEEICDHITLINKSKNILSGRVDDIRHRHGNNIFQVDYRGEEETLRRALASLGESCEIMEGAKAESVYRSLKVHVRSDEEVRRVVAATNEAVDLRSFREIIPSMNDIFIRAVQGNL